MLAVDILQLGIAGATIKEVQICLGHKEVKTTLDVNIHFTNKAKASTLKNPIIIYLMESFSDEGFDDFLMKSHDI